jgi:hypothetical protein
MQRTRAPASGRLSQMDSACQVVQFAYTHRACEAHRLVPTSNQLASRKHSAHPVGIQLAFGPLSLCSQSIRSQLAHGSRVSSAQTAANLHPVVPACTQHLSSHSARKHPSHCKRMWIRARTRNARYYTAYQVCLIHTTYPVCLSHTAHLLPSVRLTHTMYIVRLTHTMYIVRLTNTMYIVRLSHTMYIVRLSPAEHELDSIGSASPLLGHSQQGGQGFAREQVQGRITFSVKPCPKNARTRARTHASTRARTRTRTRRPHTRPHTPICNARNAHAQRPWNS